MLYPYSFLAQIRGQCRLAAAALTLALVSPSLVYAADAVSGGYSPDVDYGRGSVVVGSDGNAYRALDAVKGKDPVGAKDTVWQLAQAAFDITLDVPGRFDSIEKAFSFIAGATISDTATVTVQLAPGTYELNAPLSIGHSHGRRVELKGGKNPAKTLLTFTSGSGIIIDDGRSLRIEGLTLKGGQTGLLVDHGAYAILTRVAMKDFRTSILVENGSTLSADQVDIEANDGDYGIRVTSTSRGQLTKCLITRPPASSSSKNITFGIDAGTCASIVAHDCEVSGWGTGVLAHRSGAIVLVGCKASGNGEGGAAYLTSTFQADNCSFNKNRERGVYLNAGMANLANCEIRDNKKMGISSSNNSVVDFGGAPCVISGSEVGLHSFRGGRFHGVRPQLKDNAKDLDVSPAGSTQDDPFFLTR